MSGLENSNEESALDNEHADVSEFSAEYVTGLLPEITALHCVEDGERATTSFDPEGNVLEVLGKNRRVRECGLMEKSLLIVSTELRPTWGGDCGTRLRHAGNPHEAMLSVPILAEVAEERAASGPELDNG